ncbi:hypothetical protein DL96DRAFT_1474374 [Flagelloscypha sp. PMI_526]|nr:hypothetical protein DL96DRAFT_1474374 [Flagelloscypha sp. PMI_526]
MTAIDQEFPFKKFLGRIDRMRRGRASVLYQIRTNHVPLNFYLYRFKRSDTQGCPHCGETETVRHYLFTCPAYARERQRLRERAGRSASSLKELMASDRKLEDLVRYISSTKRFKAQGF